MAILIIGLIIFLAGATTGIMAVIIAGIRREEREFSLTRQAPGRLSQGARIATGLHVRARSDRRSDTYRPDVHV
jgi:hypothetical protein